MPYPVHEKKGCVDFTATRWTPGGGILHIKGTLQISLYVRVALNRQVARFIGRDTPKSYLGNAARKQERLGLVIKRGRSSGVRCVAVRHEHDQTLPRTREQDTIGVQEVQLARLVANLLYYSPSPERHEVPSKGG